MKHLIILMGFFIFSSSIFAQSDGTRERSMLKFSQQVNKIVKSKSNTKVKEDRLLRVIGKYMADWNAIAIAKELSHFLDELETDSRYSIESVKLCLSKLVNPKNEPGLPFYGYANSKHLNKSDINCRAAYRIYEEIGLNQLAGDDFCLTNDCDPNGQVDAKARGITTKWKYTGTKKYFTDDQYWGWRYYCTQIDRSDSEDEVIIDGGGVPNPDETQIVMDERRIANPDEEQIVIDEGGVPNPDETQIVIDEEGVPNPDDNQIVKLRRDNKKNADRRRNKRKYAWKRAENVDQW